MPDSVNFGDCLADAVRRVGNPVVVGLDPRAANLPAGLRPPPGADLSQVAAAFGSFSKAVIDAVAGKVAVVKPQAAFFEQCGPAGALALADVILHARRAGLLVILDGKRNDIGSTAAAYAQAYLGANSAWHADALTVSPYLGDDSLDPFVDAAHTTGAGIFVLVKTSNPGGSTLQDLVADGRPIYEHTASLVEALAVKSAGRSGYGSVGAVVGATYPAQLAQLRTVMPHAWLLVPGFGAQGGGAEDVAHAFDPAGLGAVINSSRGIIFAYRREPYRARFGEQNWQDAIAAATDDMIQQLAGVREHTGK